jgi:hypothetical protein
MKYLAGAILLVLISVTGYSQTYEVGGIVAGANFIGDVGRTNYIAPNTMAFGGLFRWNRSERHSFRGSVIVANIEGDDADSPESRRQQRGYSFSNTITEVSAGIEYTFWEFDLHDSEPQSAPYLYTGLTYFWYNALRKGADDVISDYDGASTVAIPMVLGYKASLGTTMVIGFEIGARYTFTDGLDGSNPVKGLADNDRLKFGNVNSDDWYVFTGINLTFTFGRRPCYCNF